MGHLLRAPQTLVLAFGTLTSAASAWAIPGPTGNTPPGVTNLLDQFVTQLNARNAHALAALWAEEGRLYQVGTKAPLVGRAAIERAYSAGFRELLRGVPFQPYEGYHTMVGAHPLVAPHLEQEIVSVEAASENGVTVTVAWKVVNDLGPDGQLIDPRLERPRARQPGVIRAPGYEGSYQAKASRSGGQWLLTQFRVVPSEAVASSPSP
jgi:hypothetical protein